MDSWKGIAESLPVEVHHDIYPTIDPTTVYTARSLSGKAVFITGASRGIGRTTAIVFAKAGAAVAIAARSSTQLDETKAAILAAAPEAKVETYIVDVKTTKSVQGAVDEAAKTFGRLDVVISNAGFVTQFTGTMDEDDAANWWYTHEVNVFGTYNTLRASAKYLRETNGYFIAVTSIAAQLRIPGGSAYGVSKHAINRLIEFIAQGTYRENPTIKAFSLDPGATRTDIYDECGVEALGIPALDSLELSAATMLYLANGGADWLSGRYVSAQWDLGQVEREWKEKIGEKDLLVNKLNVTS